MRDTNLFLSLRGCCCLMILSPVYNVWVPLKNPISAACPIVQLNSDINYPEIVSDPRVERLSPTRMPSFPPLQIPNACPSHLLYIDCRFQWPFSFCLINLLDWFIELRETVDLLRCEFIIRGCNLGITNWKRYIRKEVGKGTNVPSSLPLYAFPKSPLFHQSRNSLNPSFWIFV